MSTTKTIQFQDTVFSNTSEWNWEKVGKLKEHVKGWSLRFTKNNLANKEKCLTIIGTPKDGTPKNIYCTKPLSNKVREAIAGGMKPLEALGVLLNYDLQMNDEGRTFVFQPQGSQMEELNVTSEVINNYEDVTF